MVHHPASTDSVADVPARSVPLERSSSLARPGGREVDLSLPENRLETTQVAMASRRLIEGFNPGGKADVPDLTITNGDQVIATGGKKLGETVLESARVQSKQGYFQASERLLGNEFTHSEKKQFTEALSKNWQKEHPGAKSLNSGDRLLTNENREAVLNNIADPALRARIGERLDKGLPTGSEVTPRRDHPVDREPKERPKDREPRELPKDRKPEVIEPKLKPIPGADVTVQGKKADQIIKPGDLSNVPDGPEKGPFLRKYDVGDRFTGLTSTYGPGFQGRETASKMRFDQNQMTAASKEFPFGTVLSVTNPQNGKEVKVVITDNGPFAGHQKPRGDGTKDTTHERVIDLSTRANRELGRPDLAPLNYKVLYIPENAVWGHDRRNLRQVPLQQLQETVKRFSH